MKNTFRRHIQYKNWQKTIEGASNIFVLRKAQEDMKRYVADLNFVNDYIAKDLYQPIRA